jgi:hypothetical protein
MYYFFPVATHGHLTSGKKKREDGRMELKKMNLTDESDRWAPRADGKKR